MNKQDAAKRAVKAGQQFASSKKAAASSAANAGKRRRSSAGPGQLPQLPRHRPYDASEKAPIVVRPAILRNSTGGQRSLTRVGPGIPQTRQHRDLTDYSRKHGDREHQLELKDERDMLKDLPRPFDDDMVARYVNVYLEDGILPRLFPSTDGQSDINTTTVGWVEKGNLNGRLCFEQWEGFEKAVTQTRDNVVKSRSSNPGQWHKFAKVYTTACEDALTREVGNEQEVFVRADKVLVAVTRAVELLNGKQFSTFPGFRSGAQLRTEDFLNEKRDDPLSIRPDVMFFASRGESPRNGVPVAVLEVTKPPSYLMRKEDFREEAGDVPSKGFIKFLNECYSGTKKAPRGNIAKRFGQVICEAAHSRSGYGVLWTFDRAVFIKIGYNNSDDIVDVDVSRMYLCDDSNQVALFYALVAFTLEALNAVRSSGARESIEKCAWLFSGSKTGDKATKSTHGTSASSHRSDKDDNGGGGSSRDHSDTGKDKGTPRSSNTTTKADSRKGDGGTGNRSKKRGSGSGKRGNRSLAETGDYSSSAQQVHEYAERWQKCWSAPFCGVDIEEETDWGFEPVDDIAERIALFDETGTGTGSEKDVTECGKLFEKGGVEAMDGENGDKSYARWCLRQWEDDELVRLAYCEGTNFIAIGGCGVVILGNVDNTPVAIKYWNEFQLPGKIILRDEILMYCWLACTHGWLMGKAIPRLIGVGMQERVGAVLITELVGEGVQRDGEGGLLVGGESVEAEEVDEIRRSTGENLEALHGCGVHHGDVAMRNLRVVRVVGSDEAEVEGKKWQATWIDFGTSRLGESEERLAREKTRCWEMFEKDYEEWDS